MDEDAADARALLKEAAARIEREPGYQADPFEGEMEEILLAMARAYQSNLVFDGRSPRLAAVHENLREIAETAGRLSRALTALDADMTMLLVKEMFSRRKGLPLRLRDLGVPKGVEHALIEGARASDDHLLLREQLAALAEIAAKVNRDLPPDRGGDMNLRKHVAGRRAIGFLVDDVANLLQERGCGISGTQGGLLYSTVAAIVGFATGRDPETIHLARQVAAVAKSYKAEIDQSAALRSTTCPK